MIADERLDQVYRLMYRLVYPIADRWWRFHGRHRGVAVALWLGDTVLAVRHSYKPGLRLPGGGVAWREDHCQTAVRELREEVGIAIDPAQLSLVATPSSPHGPIYLYEATVETMPELAIDRREIIEARFVPLTLLCDPEKIGAYLHGPTTIHRAMGGGRTAD